MASNSNKRQSVKLLSSKGKLLYPKLIVADTKFDVDGVYSTKIIIPANDAAPFVSKLKGIIDRSVEVFKSENPKKARTAQAYYPWTEEVDEQGNETGNIVFTFKLKAKGRNSKGEEWENTVALLDAKGKPCSPSEVWSGTIAKVGIEVGDPSSPYSNPAGVGVPIRLKVVQIIELKAGNDSSNPAAGFDIEEEEGFSADSISTGAKGATGSSKANSQDDDWALPEGDDEAFDL